MEDTITPTTPTEPESGKALPWRRPWVHGEPLGDDQCHAPLPATLIDSVMGEQALTIGDRRLFVGLLAIAWSRLAPECRNIGEFRAPARRLRRAILGQSTETKNRRLRESLQRLASIPSVPENEVESGLRMPAVARFKVVRTPDGDEVVWAFPEAVKAECHFPPRWTFVDLRAQAAFRRSHTLSLYLWLAGRVDLKRSEWTISTDDLRDLLGVGSAYSDWHGLWKWALEPAIREINALSDIAVTALPKAAPWGRVIREVMFRVEPSPARKKALHGGKNYDRQALGTMLAQQRRAA